MVEDEVVKDKSKKIGFMFIAMFIASIVSFILLLVPADEQNLVNNLVQVILPLSCTVLTIKLYFSDCDRNIKFISIVLTAVLLFWTLSSASWYLLPMLVPRQLHLGWLIKAIGATGWLMSYCLIAYGLYTLKNSKQWYLSHSVSRIINISWSALAIVFVAWVVASINWQSPNLEDIFKIMLYLLIDIYIFCTISKLFLMNTKIDLKYLIMSLFIFCLVNSIGDIIYEINFLYESSFMSENLYYITGVVYNVSILFLSSALFIYTTNDIREKTLGRLSKKLKDTTLAMENIVMKSPDAICIFDTAGRAALVNDHFLGLLGMKRSDVSRHLSLSMLPEKIREISPGDLAKLREGASTTIPLAEMPTGAKNPLYMQVKLYPIMTSDDQIASYAIVMEDITERVMLEHDLKVSLDEKEMLLKEVHHRVKNNLQIVNSLLSLQSAYISEQKSLDAFRETQNRVMSMALIHEKLYRSKDLARIDFSEYIQMLASQITATYSTKGNVEMKISADKLLIGIDIAVPCGLMINEMISNSMKHAFPDGRSGEIVIDMHEVSDNGKNVYRLSVKDNGIGLPEGFDINEATTLGMVLISSLAGQLNGSLEIKSSGGTEYSILLQDMSGLDQPAAS